MTMTITYIENLQKAIPETSDLWDIWPEWHGIMIWPEKTKTKTIREHPERAIKEIFTYETMTGTKTKLFIKSVTLDPPVAKGLIVIITFIGYQHNFIDSNTSVQWFLAVQTRVKFSRKCVKKTPSKVTWRWWLCVLMICLGFHLFINLRWKLVLLFFSYFFLWSTKVMFRDNDENETKMIITYYDSISSLSKNQRTEVWWKL